jgi:signal transduction histidine kinase
LIVNLASNDNVTGAALPAALAHTLDAVQDRTTLGLKGEIALLKHQMDLLLVAFHDTEQQLWQAQKMEVVGELTGGIAHDFNNILTVITGMVEILADGVADKPDLATAARMINDAAGRGGDLTQRLLAFARKQPLRPCATDLNAAVAEAAKMLAPTLGERIRIEMNFADNLGTVLVDQNQLAAALLNLGLNARDAMPGGGVLTVETGTIDGAELDCEIPPGGYIAVAIHDSGTGIAAAIKHRVFEPFFTTKDVGRGSGLGLAMVHGFIKQCGGQITIDSEEGQGTTVRMYLPRA